MGKREEVEKETQRKRKEGKKGGEETEEWGGEGSKGGKVKRTGLRASMSNQKQCSLNGLPTVLSTTIGERAGRRAAVAALIALKVHAVGAAFTPATPAATRVGAIKPAPQAVLVGAAALLPILGGVSDTLANLAGAAEVWQQTWEGYPGGVCWSAHETTAWMAENGPNQCLQGTH